MRLKYIFILAFLLSFILTPLIIKLARWLKIFDYPNSQKIHSRPLPLLGGVAVYIAFMLPLLFNVLSSKPLQGVMIAGSIIFIVGLIDDIKKVPPATRLITQISAASILVLYGIKISFLPPGLLGNIGECLLTIVWIVGITNAVNFLDGIDGLASVLGIVTGGCFFLIAYQTDQLFLGCVAISLIGGLLGFLKYNFDPAKIFLGDAGSTFIGFILASIAILGNWAENNIVSLFVPILILGILIFDVCLTTIMRIKEGVVKNIIEWLEYTGKDHFHHRLIDLGFGPRGVVVLISSLSLCLGLSGIVVKDSDIQDVLLLLLQAFILFTVIAILMIVGARERREKGSG